MNSSEYIEKERPFSLEVFRHTGHSGHLLFAAELPICFRVTKPYCYDAFVLLGSWSKETLFHYLLCFFFLLATVIPMAAPPLMNNRAIHKARLLVSPVRRIGETGCTVGWGCTVGVGCGVTVGCGIAVSVGFALTVNLAVAVPC